MSCFAIDVASSAGSGDAANKADIKFRAKLSAYAKLIGSLQIEADKDCPEGQRCAGQVQLAGPPLIAEFTRKVGGKTIYSCLVTISGWYQGECVKEGSGAEDAGTGEGEREPVKVIEAVGIRDFFAKVEELPPKPSRPTGPCQLYREQRGRGFEYPVCAGDCDSGTCGVVVSVKGNRFKAECVCD